jgi:hypothetical protein
MDAPSGFAAKHWVVGGIAASLLWFVGGKQYLSNRQPIAAIGWQCIAVIIALITCGWTVAQKEWLGLVAGIAVVCFEVYSIRRSTLETKPNE